MTWVSACHYCKHKSSCSTCPLNNKEFEYELVGNGVEMRVGRVVARAVRRGLELLE